MSVSTSSTTASATRGLGEGAVRAPRGPERTAKSWGAEAAKRMLMNNLDPEVAEHPEDLVVYGGTGRAARSWEAFDAIVRTLDELEPDETLLVQSGKPVGVFRTHKWAPACSSPTRTSWGTGRRGPSSVASKSSASPCTGR